MRSKRRIIITSIFVAVIAGILPIAATVFLSLHFANQKELRLLQEFAERALQRAGGTFENARAILEAMEKANVPACSPEHIALMRNATLHSLDVEEIGYFKDDILKCTSWGIASDAVRRNPADYVTADGLAVTLRMKPVASLEAEMTALHLGRHNALILPSRFVDVVIPHAPTVTLANERGQVIETQEASGQMAADLLKSADSRGISGDRFYVVATGNGLRVLLTEPRADMLSNMSDEFLILLPFGALSSLASVGAIVWLSRRRLSPRSQLEYAIRQKQFIVFYQPIIELKSRICIGAEALVRWRQPDGSLVSPNLFIPLAEECGAIDAITDQVVDNIIADLENILADDRTLHIAVNLSSGDVQSGRAIDVIDRKLSRTRIRKEQIWLEATERGFVDVDAARETLTRARAAGHSIAIDDFGTGYSSLQYLQTLPLDALKIDKSFVDSIGMDAATSAVIEHIIRMAQDLSLFSVAEGIETEGQLAFLLSMGVDYGQGWLFSKPLPPDDFIVYHKRCKELYGAGSEVIAAR